MKPIALLNTKYVSLVFALGTTIRPFRNELGRLLRLGPIVIVITSRQWRTSRR